jgi:uncharacterized flavoprotein (TIGR03862 family)
MAAEVCARAGAQVTLYDQMRLPGRKFLLAGRGGLNLTHGEPLETFISRYHKAADRLAPSIRAFPPDAVRAWADGLGADTFVGSSGRVFPKAMKASPLLRAWLARLAGLGVVYQAGARLVGLDASGVQVDQNGQRQIVRADAIILAMGGASWPELGSDGAWVQPLSDAGVRVAPLQASNVAVLVDWPAPVAALAGAPLKLVEIQVGEARFRGEALISEGGLEGQAIYAAGAAIPAMLQRNAGAEMRLDLQPNRSLEDLQTRLAQRNPKRTLAAFLQKNCGLSPAGARLALAFAVDRTPAGLAGSIKACALTITGLAPIARAISTAGGIAFDDLNPDLSLKRWPTVFACGEMLDWDAPTGGYLLQACLSTAVAAAKGALNSSS